MAAILAAAGCASVTNPEAPAPTARVAASVTIAPARPDAPVAVVALVVDPEAAPAAFATWVAAFRANARAQGIDDAILGIAFDDVQFLPRVLELDRSQPEFSRRVWDYLDSAASPQRIATGQEKLLQFRNEAEAAAARYGVPPNVVVAIWGLESNYGGNFGNTPTLDALATLGFDGRRERFAREQLLAALKILQNGDIDRAHMVGSWAGAMGQTQFLPSAFLAYAVDADGDGRRDIWGSLADVMASTAHFLSRSGWVPTEPWGVEVRLPLGFDHGRADPALRQSTAQWRAEGVLRIDDTPLPEMTDASILLPAGARGPAFLVGSNFRAILRYNNSTSYALAAGLLAQQLAGGPGVQMPWPRDLVALTRSQVLALQSALNEAGFASGTPDGLAGPATRDALRQFQRSVGLPADGFPTLDLLARLQAR